MSGPGLPSGVEVPGAAAAAAGGDADTESVAVVRRRIRTLNKKLYQIEQIEAELVSNPGKILEPGQVTLLDSKPSIQVLVDELNRLIEPIKTAVAQDVASAIAKFLEEGIEICSGGVVGDDATPLKPRWMRPANLPTADDSVSTVLLDTVTYIDDEKNATTAYGTRSDEQNRRRSDEQSKIQFLEEGTAFCSGRVGGDDATPLKPHWMRPANHPTADDSVYPRPETVLLDAVAYLDDEANTTTAYGARSDGQSKIQVTFWIAQPPHVSYFTVHFPGHKPGAFPKLPRVVATEDGLALLRIPVSPDHNLEEDRVNEFFIYCAGTGNQLPTLRRLPNPDPRYYADKEVGILHCPTDDTSDNRFFIVVLYRNPFPTPVTRYIHMFDSETWKWDTKPVSSPEGYSYYITDKVFTIGGRYGSIAWVDLWRGIFIYDVFLGGNKISYKALPSSGLPTLKGLGRTVRDMVMVNGFIKYFCMYSPGVDTTNISGDWLAYAWRMKYPLQDYWQQDCHFKASEIMDKQKHSERLKDMPDGVEKPVLMLRAGSPVLSLHDVDVVYILTKPMYIDDMAWVHAVNMSTKTVQGIAEFSAERTVGFMFTYTQSRIFKPKVIEVKEENHENEEDSWTLVSCKKKHGTPAGARQRLPSREGMHSGMSQRGHQMGLNNRRCSGTLGGRGGRWWSRPHNGAGRGGQVHEDRR